MRRALLLCGLLAAPLGALAGAPADAVRRCAGTQLPAETRGLPAVEAACPGLGAALDALGLRALISGQSRDSLTPAMLEDALSLATPAQRRAVPDVRPLHGVLDSIRVEPPKRTLWTRFIDWLRATFGPRVTRERPNWFARLLDNITVTDATWRLIRYGLVMLVVSAAGWIVYTELKAAGLLRGPRRGARPGRDSPLPGAEPAPLLADLARLPPSERVGALFRLVLAALAERRRLAIARSSTHRQLREGVQLDDEAATRRFATLALAAEQQLYGPAPVDAERRDMALADGEALYATLTGPGRR